MIFICGNQGGEKGRRELNRRVKEGRNNQPRNSCKLASGTRHNPMDPVLNSGRYPFLLNAMSLTFPGKIPALWVSLDMLLYRMSIIWGCVLRKLRQFFSAVFLFPLFAFIPTSSPLTSSNMRKCSKLRVGSQFSNCAAWCPRSRSEQWTHTEYLNFGDSNTSNNCKTLSKLLSQRSL